MGLDKNRILYTILIFISFLYFIMSISEKSIQVNCSRERAFSYLDSPKNHERFTPSLKDIRNKEELDNGGKKVNFTYSILGLQFTGQLREIERENMSRMLFEMSGDIEGEIEIEVSPTDGETEISYCGRYDLLDGLAGKILSPAIKRYNDRQVAKILNNIKSDLEE